MTIQSIKDLYYEIPEKVRMEIYSFANTFFAIFISTVALAPAINVILQSEVVPTITQLKDVAPVLFDAASRSLWLAFITQMGLSYRK